MMTVIEVKNVIIKALDELGVIVDLGEDDIDLRENIQDSLQFISFIVNLEQELDIEIPDELLLLDSLTSLNSFSYQILEIVNNPVG